jgi:Putative restriction endonuclease
VKKLQKYQRFQIREVWFWENNQFSIYYLKDDEYEQISQSQLLPSLDIKMLETCILIPSRLEAIKTFTKQLKINN